MKKVLAIVLLLVILVVPMAGCTAKEPIATADFYSIMEDSGAVVGDATTQFAGQGVEVTVSIAMFDNFQIELFEFEDTQYSISTFNTNKASFENANASQKSMVSSSTKNGGVYKQTTDTKYNVVLRVQNTVIYISAAAQYKAEVDKMIEAIGY